MRQQDALVEKATIEVADKRVEVFPPNEYLKLKTENLKMTAAAGRIFHAAERCLG